jgi:hypothetical protein
LCTCLHNGVANVCHVSSNIIKINKPKLQVALIEETRIHTKFFYKTKREGNMREEEASKPERLRRIRIEFTGRLS